MKKLRYVNTHFWDDGYIVYLEPLERYLFLYFLTNPLSNIAGAYEITLKRISTDTGLDIPTVKAILEKFESDGKIYFRDDWVYLPNFLKNQSLNENMWKSVESLTLSFPVWIQDNLSERFERLSKDSVTLPNPSPIIPNPSQTIPNDNDIGIGIGIGIEDEKESEGANAPLLPALAFYREVFPKFKLSIFQTELLETAKVVETEFRECVRYWASHGYSEKNIDGLLNCYQNGSYKAKPKTATTQGGIKPKLLSDTLTPYKPDRRFA